MAVLVSDKTSVSLGEPVWVKLTPLGKEVLNRVMLAHQKNVRATLHQHVSRDELQEGFPQPDENGWYEFNLMDLMQWFGSDVRHGSSHFEGNEVYFIEPIR